MMDKDEERKKDMMYSSPDETRPHCCSSFLSISMINTEMDHFCLDPLLKQVKKDEVLPSTGKSSHSVHQAVVLKQPASCNSFCEDSATKRQTFFKFSIP